MNKIDCHQHLVYPDHFSYPWLAGTSALQDDAFRLEHYEPLAAASSIIGSIFMEMDVAPECAAAEAELLCHLAEQPPNKILGVIASGRPEDAGFAAHLDAINHPALKGMRRILHNQDDTVGSTTRFRENIAALAACDLTFDICVLARQLPLAAGLADACPNTRLMLDHCGVPDIAGGAFDTWRDALRELARRPHVWCKLSGIVTCCPPGTASAAILRPWVNEVLESFGPERMVWGGDWPVCNLGSSLPTWSAITEELLASLSDSEQARILCENAVDFYRIQPPLSH